MISVIIVKYKSEKFLPACLSSIGKDPKWEVIVVNNDQENQGFGAGCNQGAKRAQGRYLFFLNPDTLVLRGTIETLVKFLEKNKNAAIVAPLLLDRERKAYSLQGSRELTPLTGMIALSFLNKYFPNNSFSHRYWLKDWDKSILVEVEVAPGTAFLIRRKIFEEIGGFDPRFFLYFEETDLCKRIKKKGWGIFIEPKAKVIHFSKGSTPQNENIKKIFRRSRFYYFKKHFGILSALVVEFWLRSTEWLAKRI